MSLSLVCVSVVVLLCFLCVLCVRCCIFNNGYKTFSLDQSSESHELNRSAHELNRSAHELNRSAHELNGSAHRSAHGTHIYFKAEAFDSIDSTHSILGEM